MFHVTQNNEPHNYAGPYEEYFRSESEEECRAWARARVQEKKANDLYPLMVGPADGLPTWGCWSNGNDVREDTMGFRPSLRLEAV